MSNYNRTEHLKKLHNKRKAITQEKVDKAIQRLIKAQKSINFNSVASESGVTKKTLYDNKRIRERIETLRHQQSQVPTPSQVKREMNDNNKDAIIASLKRKIKRLKEENKELKDQLKINYAEIYKQL
ncbi:transposase [Clostridium botulinum]|nr:transposase [Clostridium botulinum]